MHGVAAGLDQFCRVYSIGEFSQGDARQYLAQQLQSRYHSGALTDDEWTYVHDACGGHAGLLKDLAIEYMRCKLWQQGKCVNIDTVVEELTWGMMFGLKYYTSVNALQAH
eukprot:jgi/Chlat1/6396/Chrsp44S05842